jgi:hypothetical protein
MQNLKAVTMGVVASIEFFWPSMANPATLYRNICEMPQGPILNNRR